jgi:hypothetical protein
MPRGKDGGAFVRVMIYGVLGGGFGAWWFSRISRKPTARVKELRVTADGIYADGKRLLARDEIRSARVYPGRVEGAFVRLERRNVLKGPIDLQVWSLDEGRKLLRALGMDASQTASSFAIAAPSIAHFRRRLHATWGTLAAIVVGLPTLAMLGFRGGGFALACVAAFIAYATIILRMVKTASVVVGADGVYVRWLWEKQFIPIHDIVRAEVVDEPIGYGMYAIVVRIHRRSGEPVDLMSARGRADVVGPFQRVADLVRARAAGLAERIDEAVLGAGRGTSSARDLEQLDRGGRAIGDWVAALRGLRGKIATFREQATGGIDALWRVLEDADAAPEQRVAAAVALSPDLDPGGRERLRIVAQATVSPKLRIALEAAAEDDDERLVRALEEVSAAGEAERDAGAPRRMEA